MFVSVLREIYMCCSISEKCVCRSEICVALCVCEVGRG